MINVLKNVLALMALVVCIVASLWLAAWSRSQHQRVNADSSPIN